MIATKTKPDGWVVEFPNGTKMQNENGEPVLYLQECDAEKDRREQEECFQNGGIVLPICLVPPALLDWVEEVEKELQVQSFDWCRHLLNKLREVRG